MSDSIECQECGAHLKPENEAAHMRKVHPNVAFQQKNARSSGAAKPRFYVTSRTKKTVFVLMVAVVLMAAGTMVYLSTLKVVPLDASAKQVHISMAGWDPPSLTTKVGTPLKIDVMALDDAHGAGHDFIIDALSINEYVGSTQKVFALPASQPGQYTFYCSLCCGGKDSPTMVGSYTVEA